jgi:hypothetical protein
MKIILEKIYSLLIFLKFFQKFFQKFLRIFWREPDVVLYNQKNDSVYLRRWYVIPRNNFGNIYLHNFLSSDEDRALHDHPWWNISILLSGCYFEHIPKDSKKWIEENDRTQIVKKRYPFIPIFRNSESIHKIELIQNKPIWTLFITGPVAREWGFYCPNFWRHHNEFLDKTGSKNGKGCE